MPLNPTAEVTPLNPVSRSYDTVAGIFNHYVYLSCFGVTASAWSDTRLIDQYNQDKIVLNHNEIVSPAPSVMPSPFFDYAVAFLGFLSKATTENQYLLIYHVVGMYGAKAAFYINGNLVRSEAVDGEEYIAILVDCPPSQTWWDACMFLEGTGRLDLKGVQLFIL